MTVSGESQINEALAALAKMDRPARVNQAMKWVLSGATAYDVRESIRQAFPGDDPAGLILEAMQGLEAAASFDPPVVLGWCFEASRDLYRRMVEIGDFPGALRAIKQIAELTRNVQHRDEAQEQAEPVKVRSRKKVRGRKVAAKVKPGKGHSPVAADQGREAEGQVQEQPSIVHGDVQPGPEGVGMVGGSIGGDSPD